MKRPGWEIIGSIGMVVVYIVAMYLTVIADNLPAYLASALYDKESR